MTASLNELSAVFGDCTVLDRIRHTLADPAALPVFASLLDTPEFR